MIIGILAVITGIYGLSKISKKGGTGKWKCIVAIIVGVFGIGISLLMLLTLSSSGRPPGY